MANERPGGDWRRAEGGNPSPARSPKTSRRAWQPGGAQTPAAAGKARSRSARLLVAGGVTGAIAGLIVLVIWLFWPARYPQLVLVGTTSGDSLALPENAAGANAGAEFTNWAGEGHDRDRPRLDADPAVTVDASGAKIAIDPRPKNLVIYFSAHGGADANGPYLWMAAPDARSANDAHKVRVRDIIDHVGKSRRGKPTLLVFDATRVTVSWPLGMLFNDFARSLKELDGPIEAIPGLAVIAASDDDQRSWLFEERRVSVFSYYLLEAMRGAGHDRGQRVTAASAFANVKAEVERWSIANRAEKQSPILLPQASGQARAEKVDLAATPASGYPNPPSIELPASVPAELTAAWKKANELAAQVPAPETNNPAKWREYLDLLVRYERLFRLGANTNTVRDRIGALAAQLQNAVIGGEPACLPTAIPTARALGRPPLFGDGRNPQSDQFRDEFQRVWRPIVAATSRADAWAALLRRYPGRETQARTAAAQFVVAQLIDDGPTPDNLTTADAVLAITHGAAGLPAPAEAHFVRMLHGFLDKRTRPDVALLKEALTLRRDAEEAAWVFMAGPKEYPYSEVVYPWVRSRIEAGDRNRQLGQDLLFGTDARMWAEAARLFAAARKDYADARADGAKVAAALATRDRIFARLPYYARWLAAYRGSRAQTEVDRLIEQAEKAFRGAHHLANLTAKDEPPTDQLTALDQLRAETDGHFKAIADAFDADLARFTNEPRPSIWHALDAALTVPFIPAQRRIELLSFVRHVSYQLEANRQQLDGSQVPPAPTREVATRTGRLALALLGDNSLDRRQQLDSPNPNGWWTSYRAVGDQLGEHFRTLAKEAKDDCDKSARAQTLQAGGGSLAAAALLGRLADPAAPLATPDPVAADQRYRRQSFLLWQAERVTKEGWADVARTTPDGWYCRKVAATLVGSAEALIRQNAAELTGRPAENLAPDELDRWLADCRRASQRRPVELVVKADPAREVADEPEWTFSFQMNVAAKDRGPVGYPVSWLTAPGNPYPQADAASLARHVETDFAENRLPVSRRVRFIATGPPRDFPETGKLTSTVFYRGHLYQMPTEVVLVGTPTRDLIYRPPQGAGAFAIRTDRSAVAGAVTILVDLTSSMTTNRLVPGDDTSPRRIEGAKKGLELVLKQLPRGTTVTLAYFYGDGTRKVMTVEPYGRPLVMDGTNWDTVYDSFKDAKAEGGSTPLAGAIAKVLNKDNLKTFWPGDATTGSRTLIVLTDGEDNWGRLDAERPSVYQGGKEPGEYALQAHQATPDDVNLHIVFFGLVSKKDRDEEERAKRQFEQLGRPENYQNPPRTPAQLWTGVRDSTALADLCRRAMLPQFRFARGEKSTDRLEATLAGEAAMRVTTALSPGVYDLRGLRGQQAVQLRPADRVLMEARKNGDKFELFLPTYGHEIAEKHDFPRATTGSVATNGLHAAIPAFELDKGSIDANVKLSVTLEPLGERGAANLLEMPRPKFAWFDATYADGKPAEKGLVPALRVENRWPLWAPGWDLTLQHWERAGVDRATARHPLVTAYWLDGFPVPAANYPVNLADLPGSWERLQKFLTVRVRENDVTLLSISREEYEGAGLPKGEYFTVRMKYGKPGELVYLRPGNLKGTDQPFALYERHIYYDAQSRYTARFGPIFNTDPNKDITLELYSVAALREASAKAMRSVTLRLPAGPLPNDYGLPQELSAEPRKK